MVLIGDKIISPEIFTERFACDYGVCGGVCSRAGRWWRRRDFSR